MDGSRGAKTMVFYCFFQIESRFAAFSIWMKPLTAHRSQRGAKFTPKSNVFKTKRSRGAPGPIATAFGCHWATYQFCTVFGRALGGAKIGKDRDTEGIKADPGSGEASEYTRLRSRKRHLQQRPATLKACFRNIYQWSSYSSNS